ncbi:NUDIX hydrolase [Risungbinella massiliensis]|uniref:NUDIX hydrolase n=1 Tax=Risungbinella massiliensis TaxID=1329796 RepID=UPI0005CC4EDB|nr:NUDIX domain-containing protein [Risungbinella massiliensis]
MKKERFCVPVTIHVFFRKGDQILLLRRFQTGYQDGNYSVVAGHLDGDETVIQAAIREAKEEAGVDIEETDVHMVGVMHRRSDSERIDFFAEITKWSGEIENREPNKCDDLRFFPVEELPVNTIPYVRQAISNYLQNKWFDLAEW